MNKTDKRKPVVISKFIDIDDYQHLSYEAKKMAILQVPIIDIFPQRASMANLYLEFNYNQVEAIKNCKRKLYIDLFTNNIAKLSPKNKIGYDADGTKRVRGKTVFNWSYDGGGWLYWEITTRKEAYYEPLKY